MSHSQPIVWPEEIEATFVKTFIARDRRERWLVLLSSEKKRHKLLARLPHIFDVDLDPRFVHNENDLAPDIAAQVDKVLRDWRKANLNQLCYILAPCSERDGQMMELSKVETDYSLTYGAVVIVIPDKLAYYRTERSNINKQPYYVLFHPTSDEHN